MYWVQKYNHGTRLANGILGAGCAGYEAIDPTDVTFPKVGYDNTCNPKIKYPN